MSHSKTDEELLNAINTIHLTKYSDDPAFQLNQQNYRMLELIKNYGIEQRIDELEQLEKTYEPGRIAIYWSEFADYQDARKEILNSLKDTKENN